MELKLSEEDGKSGNPERAQSEKSELSDLIFSFDSDSEAGHNTLAASPQQSCDTIPLHSPSPSSSPTSRSSSVHPDTRANDAPDKALQRRHALDALAPPAGALLVAVAQYLGGPVGRGRYGLTPRLLFYYLVVHAATVDCSCGSR
ncbi:hypothetical protein O1611_g677 [Lasiodiplodia mahajangana]|uniref:Uncharacterized protein n=1 Tax=Lasiodiplodia mahajangana TaxID=1108764 RepID=A0ACC2K043_9PEZI|nr:hypothetical protein O1611_g677 [Lasiodiplodia mahajangana]